MDPTALKPSSRLQRAADAERQDLRRQHRQLVASRAEILDSLRTVDRSITEIEERMLLLTRLAPDLDGATSPAEGHLEDGRQLPGKVLRGPEIRDIAVRLLVRRGSIEALHYRDWFDLVRDAGYSVAGKDGLAVFLTQISRSPAVRKGTQAGVYELDRRAPQRLERELERLQGEMRELTVGTSGAADLAEIRTRRERLTTAIGKTERALEEARRVLAPDVDGDEAAATLLAAG